MNCFQNEIWKDIKGYEGLYQISNYGRVKSLYSWNGHRHVKDNKILKCSHSRPSSKKSYQRSIVKLYKNGKKKNYKVHRLVAEHFIPNPNNYKAVNHLDCNPMNNKVTNLEWCTQKHNFEHSRKMQNIVYKIDVIERETLVDILNKGLTYDEIAEMLGVAKGTVFNYIKRFKIKRIYV